MQKKSYVSPANQIREQAYNLLKDELESQNATLMKQRQNIISSMQNPHVKRKNVNPSQYSIIDQSGFITENEEKQDQYPGGSRNKQIVNICKKIYEVIDLCGSDQQFRQVIQAQCEILDFLTVQTKKKQLQNKRQSKKLQRVRSQSKIQKKSVRQKLTQKGYNRIVADDLMVMIEEIQRKALDQIQKLRRDKIMLMKKLNQQVKIYNNQKRRSITLQNKLTQLQNSKYYAPVQIKKKMVTNLQNPIQQNSQQNLQEYSNIKNVEKSPYSKIAAQKHHRKQSNHSNISNPQQKNVKNNFSNQHEQAFRTSNRPQQNVNANFNPNVNPNAHDNPNANIDPNFAQNQTSNHLNNYQFRDVSIKNRPIFREAQSIHPQNTHYSNPKIIPVHSQFQIQSQINKLRNQNQQMKSQISQYNNSKYMPIKSQLKSQIKQLENKAMYYQQAIQNSRPNLVNPIRYANFQYQNLMNQAHMIQNEGKKLIKARSNPHFGRNSQVNNYREYFNQKSRLNYSPRNVENQYRNFSPSFSYNLVEDQKFVTSKYEPNQYAKIIQDMKIATQS